MYCKRKFTASFEGVYARFGLFALTAVLLAGCATYVRDTAWEPAAYNFRGANRLILTEVTGRSGDRALMLEILREEAARDGWWHLIDRRHAVHQQFQGGLPGPGEVWCRIHVHEIDIDRRYRHDLDEGKKTDGNQVMPKLDPYLEGEVSFATTALGPGGEVVMREQGYEAEDEAEDELGEESELEEELVREVVREFLDDITPRERTRLLRIDEDADDMKSVAELIRNRSYRQALIELETLRERWPHRADITYNIGVILQGMGRYEEALAQYNRAIQDGPKPYYHTARDRCVQRLQQREQFQ